MCIRDRSADRKAVDPVVQAVMAIVRQIKAGDGKEDAIELALQEALANAVIHGAREDPTKTVECLVSSDEEQSVLIVAVSYTHLDVYKRQRPLWRAWSVSSRGTSRSAAKLWMTTAYALKFWIRRTARWSA